MPLQYAACTRHKRMYTANTSRLDTYSRTSSWIIPAHNDKIVRCDIFINVSTAAGILR